MSGKAVRVALAGAGAVAQTHAEALQRSAEAQLVGVADLRAEAAHALGEQAGCPAFTSPSSLLDEVSCDALIVCTPPASHREVCLAALERGIPVLCEKPLSVDLESAREMVAAAEAADVLLTMASKFRFVPDVVRAKSIVASGLLGEIILLENSFTSRLDMTSRWNADPAVSGGGVLIDNGTHSVDLVRYFLGPLQEVQAIEAKRIQSLPVEDSVHVLLRSAAGAMAVIDVSWSISKELESFLSIHGSGGTLEVGWSRSRYRLSGSRDWVVFGDGYDKVEAFQRLLEDFCRAVRTGAGSTMTTADAIASVEVVAAAYESLGGNHWIAVRGAGRSRGAQAAKRPSQESAA